MSIVNAAENIAKVGTVDRITLPLSLDILLPDKLRVPGELYTQFIENAGTKDRQTIEELFGQLVLAVWGIEDYNIHNEEMHADPKTLETMLIKYAVDKGRLVTLIITGESLGGERLLGAVTVRGEKGYQGINLLGVVDLPPDECLDFNDPKMKSIIREIGPTYRLLTSVANQYSDRLAENGNFIVWPACE